MYRHSFRLAAAICCLAAPLSHARANAALGEDDSVRAAIRVQVLSSREMQKQDAELLAGRQSDIAKAAELYGYDLSSGMWIRNQVLCPDAPNYLLMHYLRIAQHGGIWLFTTVIPRENGPIRIIPVLYHGTQAFRLFGSSPEQRELINEIVPAKKMTAGATQNVDWWSLAYCYAALAGVEPAATSVTAPEEITPIISISPEGSVRELNFSVVGPDQLRQDWRILFDKHSQVRSIELSTAPLKSLQPIPESSPRTRPLPSLK